MSAAVALFVGDLTHDVTLSVPAIPEPDGKVTATALEARVGGMAVNAAVACRRGAVPARLLVRTGDDVPGVSGLAAAREAGVDVRAAMRNGPTAHAIVLLEPGGEKRLVLHPGVSMYPGRDQIEAVELDDVAWVQQAVYDVHAAAALVRRCRERRIRWSLDLEPSTFPGGIESLAPCIDGAAALFCNAASLARVGADPVARLFALGARAVVETRGGAGAALHRPDAGTETLPAPATAGVVDTTGAGDCLAGRYVAGRVRGLDPVAALREAVDAASSSCTRPGSWPSYPWRDPADAEKRPDP